MAVTLFIARKMIIITLSSSEFILILMKFDVDIVDIVDIIWYWYIDILIYWYIDDDDILMIDDDDDIL